MGTGCSDTQDAAPREEAYTAVEVAPVARDEISLTVSVGGTVKAGGEVAVVARLGGEVTDLKVSMGDRVEKGDLLVSLNAPDINLQVRQARDAVRSLRKARDELQEMIDELEERFENIGNGQEPGEPDPDPDPDNGDTEPEIPQWLRDLLEDGNFSLDPAMSLRQQMATLEAQLAQAERGLEMARLGQANLSVRAPISGLVTFLNVVRGAAVGPGSPLLMLSDDDGYLVEANVLESLITLIQPGDPVQVELPIAGETFSGSVTEVAPAPMPNTRMYPVKVAFEPWGTGRVLPGMFARIAFITESSGETLVIPRSAVLQRAAGNTVFIAREDRAEARLVTLGLQDRDRVQVLSGLREGESLVVRGQHFLEEGSRIKIVEGSGAPEGEGN